MALAEARRQVDAVRVADRWQLSAGGSVRCRPRRTPPVDPSRESAPLIDPRFPGRTIVIPAFTGRDSDGAGRKKEGRRAPKDDTFRGTAPGKPARIAAAGFPGRVPGVAATRVHHPGQADRNNAGRFRSVGTAARRRDHRDLRDCPRGSGGTGPTPPRTAGEWGDGCRVVRRRPGRRGSQAAGRACLGRRRPAGRCCVGRPRGRNQHRAWWPCGAPRIRQPGAACSPGLVLSAALDGAGLQAALSRQPARRYLVVGAQGQVHGVLTLGAAAAAHRATRSPGEAPGRRLCSRVCVRRRRQGRNR